MEALEKNDELYEGAAYENGAPYTSVINDVKFIVPL
jgi:hypothetical protein